MDIPGVSFCTENKKIFSFPLLSGIHQSKMPVPSEFQGVTITGSEIDTQCFLDVKNEKQGSDLFQEATSNLICPTNHIVSKKGMCGHLNTFSAISISQLVGGFVGSKSQIRSVNREACQIWDVIFRQLAETSYQSHDMKNGTHSFKLNGFNKTFSNNIFNPFCDEGGSTLDGIASFLISQNCEFLDEQQMIQDISKSENKKVKSLTLISNDIISKTVDVSSPPQLSTSNLKSTIESSQNTPKQSYADVAKSPVSCRSHVQPTLPQSISNKNSSKFLKKMKKYESKEPLFKHTSEKDNWRERNGIVDFDQQQSLSKENHNKKYRKSEVYPAFNRKNRASNKKLENNGLEHFSKKSRSNFKGSTKDVISDNSFDRKSSNKMEYSQSSQFGKKFKLVPKSFCSRAKEFHKGKKYLEKRDMFCFNLQASDESLWRNWRCKNNGVECKSIHDCEEMVRVNKSNPFSSGVNISQSTLSENSSMAVNSNLKNSSASDNCHDKTLDSGCVTSDLTFELPTRMDCISVSSSFGDLTNISDGRERFLSECSVDSEDSFVVMFESNCLDDASVVSYDMRTIHQCSAYDSDESDSWSECSDDCVGDSDDQKDLDEVDFCFFPSPIIVSGENCDFAENVVSDRLKDINKKWKEENDSISSEEKASEKVHFANEDSLTTVHVMVKWDFAYRAARCGPWEEMARDRSRFQGRIDRTEAVLASILAPEHRHKIQQRLISSAIT